MDTTTLFSLEGRSALVTGGSRGIGKDDRRGLLRQGARVYITARKVAVCDETAKGAVGARVRQSSPPVDVSTTEGIEQLVAAYSAMSSPSISRQQRWGCGAPDSTSFPKPAGTR